MFNNQRIKTKYCLTGNLWEAYDSDSSFMLTTQIFSHLLLLTNSMQGSVDSWLKAKWSLSLQKSPESRQTSSKVTK